MSITRSKQESKDAIAEKKDYSVQNKYFESQDIDNESKVDILLSTSHSSHINSISIHNMEDAIQHKYLLADTDSNLHGYASWLKAAQEQRSIHVDFLRSLSPATTADELKVKLKSLVRIPDRIEFTTSNDDVDATEGVKHVYRFTLPNVEGQTLLDFVLRSDHFDTKTQCELIKILFDLGYIRFLDDIIKLPLLDLIIKKPELNELLLSEYRNILYWKDSVITLKDEQILWIKLLSVEGRLTHNADSIYYALMHDKYDHSIERMAKCMTFLKCRSAISGDAKLIIEKVQTDLLNKDFFGFYAVDRGCLEICHAWFKLLDTLTDIRAAYQHIRQHIRPHELETLPALKALADARLKEIYAGTKYEEVEQFLAIVVAVDPYDKFMENARKAFENISHSEQAIITEDLEAYLKEDIYNLEDSAKLSDSQKEYIEHYLEPFIKLAATRTGDEAILQPYEEFLKTFYDESKDKLTENEKSEIIQYLESLKLPLTEFPDEAQDEFSRKFGGYLYNSLEYTHAKKIEIATFLNKYLKAEKAEEPCYSNMNMTFFASQSGASKSDDGREVEAKHSLKR